MSVPASDIKCTQTPYPFPDLYYSAFVRKLEGNLLYPIGMKKTPAVWVFKPTNASDLDTPKKLCDTACNSTNYINYKHPLPLFNCLCSNGIFPTKIDGAYPLGLKSVDGDGLFIEKNAEDDYFYEAAWIAPLRSSANSLRLHAIGGVLGFAVFLIGN